MKKIIIFMTPILVAVIIAFGCSKDHDAPTFNTISNNSSAPDNVIATYVLNETTDAVNVSWTMADTAGVIDYLVTVSDSSNFNIGKVFEYYSNIDEADLVVQPYDYDYDIATYQNVAEGDSIILYFTVSAVYTNDTFRRFIGPRSVVDSTLVKK